MNESFEKSNYMEDSHGNLTPKELVKPIDHLRDQVVMEIVNRAITVNKTLTDFKISVMSEIAAFIELSAEQYSVHYGGTKGNVSLLSYNGEYKVMRSINDYIVFDERLQIAKTLIDECVKEWSGDSRSEVRALINHAFQVDKAGKISTDRILGLRRLDIKNPNWLKAMEAISDSIMVTGSKEYVRIYKRDSAGKYQQINLDLAAI